MRRRMVALLGTALVSAACGTTKGESASSSSSPAPLRPSTSASPAATGMTTYELIDGVTVRAPAAWYSADYRGYPATVWFPLRFLGTDPFTGPCTSGTPRQECAPHNFFPGDWVTPEAGVLLLWSETQFPFEREPLQHVAGEVTSVDGHRAKVSSGAAGAGCPAGSATELHAGVERYVGLDPGIWMDLTACFGPEATAQVHRDVEAMLASLTLSDPSTAPTTGSGATARE